jgi:hypothetical protein
MSLRNRGAGLPDGGFFTPEQLRTGLPEDSLARQSPSRGAVEVKSALGEVDAVARGEQVTRYAQRYGLVLVTNFREFRVVSGGQDKAPTFLEAYRIADSDAAFWAAVENPRRLAKLHSTLLFEYLARAMLEPAPIAGPDDLAWFLASYARTAKERISQAAPSDLDSIRAAMETTLGIKFAGERGERLFRSSLVQTLFYGAFSAWILWRRQQSTSPGPQTFEWRSAVWSLHVPMVKALFQQLATPTALHPLRIDETLDWAASAMNRVDWDSFVKRFEAGTAVQYFYEPFLQSFDPELRKELGVWYTPSEIVRYMVDRVDAVLKKELGLSLGLADPSVFVLDPCAGTGSYLVEVLRRIEQTLKAHGADALVANDVKRAALDRVFGFEILPAPFVVAHLQLGVLLLAMGAPLDDDKGERVAVYLTNALTGWDPPKEPQKRLRAFLEEELDRERLAATDVKVGRPILVVLGNPPYNAFGGGSPEEEEGLVSVYKEGLGEEWGIGKHHLADLYIRFFRLAERRIAEQTGRGVVCYISNYSYLSDPMFVVMRKHLLSNFDKLWIDCLNGDRRLTGKRTPDGKPDPSVFSTDSSREGIQVGTAVSLLVRRANHGREGEVRFKEFWGQKKLSDLLESLTPGRANCYQKVEPSASNWYSFRPRVANAEYERWSQIVELSAIYPIDGLLEKRGEGLIDIEKDSLEARMRSYFDQSVSWETLRNLGSGLTLDAAGYPARDVRDKVLTSEKFDSARLHRYVIRPFDHRWCYYSTVAPLWNRARPTIWPQMWPGNRFLMASRKAATRPEGVPFYFASTFGDDGTLRGHAYLFPLRLRSLGHRSSRGRTVLAADQRTLAGGSASPYSNLSPLAKAYLQRLGAKDPDKNPEVGDALWMHILSVGFSPKYRQENDLGGRVDWPRFPLPDTMEKLLSSARLGTRLAALLDLEAPVPHEVFDASASMIGLISKVGGGSIDPSTDDLRVEAGWGSLGQDGVVQPGKGTIMIRAPTPEEATSILNGKTRLKLTPKEVAQRLGDSTADVYLNDVAFWKNIPTVVWEFRIGGYQVLKKWLSYREHRVLGRALTSAEIREFTDIARRLTGVVLLGSELDLNYTEVARKSVPLASSTP